MASVAMIYDLSYGFESMNSSDCRSYLAEAQCVDNGACKWTNSSVDVPDQCTSHDYVFDVADLLFAAVLAALISFPLLVLLDLALMKNISPGIKRSISASKRPIIDSETENSDISVKHPPARVNRITLAERRAFKDSAMKRNSKLCSFSRQLVEIRNLICSTLESDFQGLSSDIEDYRNQLDNGDRCDFDSKYLYSF
jgi:hypothetical protein